MTDIPPMVFTYAEMVLTVRHVGWKWQRPIYEVRVEAPGPYTEALVMWEGIPDVLHRGFEQRQLADAVLETLYMALTPEDFWGKEDLVRKAALFGWERLRPAYGEVMKRRERRERWLRIHRSGPKGWWPPGPD